MVRFRRDEGSRYYFHLRTRPLGAILISVRDQTSHSETNYLFAFYNTPGTDLASNSLSRLSTLSSRLLVCDLLLSIQRLNSISLSGLAELLTRSYFRIYWFKLWTKAHSFIPSSTSPYYAYSSSTSPYAYSIEAGSWWRKKRRYVKALPILDLVTGFLKCNGRKLSTMLSTIFCAIVLQARDVILPGAIVGPPPGLYDFSSIFGYQLKQTSCLQCLCVRLTLLLLSRILIYHTICTQIKGSVSCRWLKLEIRGGMPDQ